MKRLSLPILATVCVLGLLTSCANYHATSLTTLSSDALIFKSAETGNVVAVAKAFNKADCKKYLDRNVLAAGYQPVQLYIENNSDKNYAFSLNRISLSCATPEEVSAKVHTSTVGRAAGYGVGALFFWPLAIPAIVDGVKSSEANRALDTDFASKAARDQIIPPHSYFNKILFIPTSEYQPSFDLTLLDQNSSKKTITVTAS